MGAGEAPLGTSARHNNMGAREKKEETSERKNRLKKTISQSGAFR